MATLKIQNNMSIHDCLSFMGIYVITRHKSKLNL